MRVFALALIAWLLPDAYGQTGAAVPELYTYYALPGDPAFTWGPITLDALTFLSRDPAGRAHLTLPAPIPGPAGAPGPAGRAGANGIQGPQGVPGPCPTVAPSSGLTIVVAPDGSCTIGTDPSLRQYSTLPAGTATPVPGPCLSAQLVYYDTQYMYPCVPDPANPSGWIQARQAYETTWVLPPAPAPAQLARLTGPPGVQIAANGVVTVTYGQIFQGINVSSVSIVSTLPVPPLPVRPPCPLCTAPVPATAAPAAPAPAPPVAQ